MDGTPKKRFWYENLIIFLLFFGTGAVMSTRFGITNTFAFMKDIQISPVEMGLIMSAHAIAWAISSVVLGSLADFVKKQRLFMIGCLLLSSVLGACIGFAKDIQTIIVLRVFIGIFQGPLLPLLQTAARENSSPTRLGFNQGCLIAGTSLLGQALPSAIIPTIASQADSAWRSPMIVIGIIGVAITVLIALVYRKPHAAEAQAITLEKQGKISPQELATLFKTRNFILGIIGAVGAIGWTLCLSTYAVTYLAKETAASTARLSAIISVSGIAGMLSNIIVPGLSDKLGRKPSYILCSLAMVMAPVVLLAFKGNMDSPLVLILYALSFFIGGCAMSLNTYVIVGESVAPYLVTTAYAVCLCVGELLGGTAGPAIAGVLAAQHGYSATMYVTMVCAAICLVASFFVRETLASKRAKLARVDA